MPLFRCNGELHFFAHVPKCAGQSIEAYLTKRFGSLAFLNDQFYSVAPQNRWTRTSPQHVAVDDIDRLFPTDWISSSFACVRNPYTRILSAYNFASVHEKSVKPDQNIVDWLEASLPTQSGDIFAHDNHVRPQCDLVPKNSKFFPLEEGLDSIIAYLDRLEGASNGPREIPQNNLAKTPELEKYYAQLPVPKELFELVKQVYAEDFKRFGYSTVPPDLPTCYVPIPRTPINMVKKGALKVRRRLRRR